MATTIIQYNKGNAVVSTCLDFLSTLKGVKIYLDTDLQKKSEANRQRKVSAREEKELFLPVQEEACPSTLRNTCSMKYSQKDIVEVNFLLPNGEFKPHMA